MNKPTDEDLYAAKYTRLALEAFNGRPIRRSYNLRIPKYWWAWLILGLLILFFL